MGQMFLALITFDDDVFGGGGGGGGGGGVGGGAVGVRVWRGAFEFITSPTRLKYGLDLM